jgi:PAS domain S-box-containing protein
MRKFGRTGSFWQWSFGAHVIALVVVGILPLAGLAFYSMTRLSDAEREMDRSQIISTARAISSSIDLQLLSAERTLRALASALPPDDRDLGNFYADCRALAHESGGWILLADREGRQILNTKRPLGTPLPAVLGSRQFKSAVATGQPQISGVLVGTIDPQPEFAIHVPVVEDGAVTRVLTMVFPTSTLNEFLARQNLPAGWTVSTLDRTGTIFARHPRSEKIVGLKASQDILDMPEAQSEGFFRLTNRENTDVYIASVRSARSGWRVNVGIPQALIEAPLRQSLQRFALLGGAALLLAIGAAAFIGRHLANTMKILARAAYALGRHQPLPVVSSTVREVNRVATALSYAGLALAEGDRQLRSSEQHLLRAQHVGGMGSIDRDLRTGQAECTDETFRLYGVDRASFEPTAENLIQMVHEEDRERVRAMALATRRGVKPQPEEYRIVRPDGEVRTVCREAELTCDENGAPIRLFITLKDVTELRATEQQLRRSQQHLALAQRVSQIGSVLCDLKTGIDEWSDELYRLLGVERSAHPPTLETFRRLVHEEDRPALVRMREAYLRGERLPAAQFRVIRPDGEQRMMRREIEPLFDGAGKPTRILMTFCDITELHAAERRQHELERQLQHAQKIEALGTLAGGIAHDLNNTLVPILGLAKLTMKRLPEDSREHANLAIIHRAGERARDLVRRILAFSRKDAPSRQRVDFAALVRDSLKMIRASLPATIQIAEAIEAAPPVLGDPGELHQIVINLVVNAAQSIGGKLGTIGVTLAAAVPLPEEPGRAWLRLSVRDTGCGMDQATLPRIFEPFFTTKPVGEGTGLGLSMVHGIVVQHGGKITVESEVGQGTRFDVYLPSLVGHERGKTLAAAAE